MERGSLLFVSLVIRDQFLGKTDGGEGKEGNDDRRDNGADECDNVDCAVVVLYDFGDTSLHIICTPCLAQTTPKNIQGHRRVAIVALLGGDRLSGSRVFGERWHLVLTTIFMLQYN
jgi:hypothetical protein